MSHSYWGYWLVAFGIAIVGLMISVQGITTTSTEDYYSVKEITEAAMLESVDYGYYRDYNEVKINKEKFMEVYVRMIAETMKSTDTYEVNFYEIYEAPPKVSVEVKSNSGTNFIAATGYDTITRVSAVLQVYAEEVDSENNSGSSDDATSNSGSSNNTVSNSVKITNKSIVNNLTVGSEVTLEIEKNPSNAVCTWKSNNTGVATVNNGVIKVHEKGVATITVTCGNKSDSVEIIVDDSTGTCTGWLGSFTTTAINDKVTAGQTYTAKAVYYVNKPSSLSNLAGSCILAGNTGIQISEAIGLNEVTNVYNSSFEGQKDYEIPFTEAGNQAEIEIEMTFKIPASYSSKQKIKLNAYLSNSNEKEITLTVD